MLMKSNAAEEEEEEEEEKEEEGRGVKPQQLTSNSTAERKDWFKMLLPWFDDQLFKVTDRTKVSSDQSYGSDQSFIEQKLRIGPKFH